MFLSISLCCPSHEPPRSPGLIIDLEWIEGGREGASNPHFVKVVMYLDSAAVSSVIRQPRKILSVLCYFPLLLALFLYTPTYPTTCWHPGSLPAAPHLHFHITRRETETANIESFLFFLHCCPQYKLPTIPTPLMMWSLSLSPIVGQFPF